MRLLLDANVPRFAAVSAYRKVAEQTTQWGPSSVTLDVLEWGPPPYDRAPRFIRENIRHIPSLALNAELKGLSFFVYDLIKKEIWNTRPAIDWANRNIHDLFGAKELECPFSTDGILFAWNNPACFDRYLNSLPNRVNDLRLSKLVESLGRKSSRDCLHAWLSDHHSIDGLLTMDKAFIGKFNQCRSALGFKVLAISPRDLCRRFQIEPASSDWFGARSDPHIFYEQHQPIPVGDYIFTNAQSERLFSSRR
jgi:hypothetical protein